MKNFKTLRFITLLLLLFLLTVWAVPQQQKKDVQTKAEKKENVVQEKTQEKKEKEEKAKPDDVGKALGDRMASGESLFKVLGIPEPEDYMPTTFEIFLLWLLPAFTIAGIIVLIVVLTKRRHQRLMAMIEKGITPGTAAVTQLKFSQFKWNLICLLTGLILSLGGVGLSIFMMGHQGLNRWYTGAIPLFVGVSLLIFYRIYYKAKE